MNLSKLESYKPFTIYIPILSNQGIQIDVKPVFAQEVKNDKKGRKQSSQYFLIKGVMADSILGNMYFVITKYNRCVF